MKKLISLVLALVMICAMATVAFAAPAGQAESKTYTIVTDTTNGSDASADGFSWNIGVEADYDYQLEDVSGKTYKDIPANYYVVVTWEVDSTLTYTVEGKYVWNVYDAQGNDAVGDNAANAGYEIEKSEGVWDGSANIAINIANWSNRDLTASVTYASATGITSSAESITGVDGDGKVELTSAAANVTIAEGEKADGYSAVDVSVNNITVTDGEIDAENVVIGTATVKLDSFAQGEKVTMAEVQG